jgi:hypothetical protein
MKLAELEWRRKRDAVPAAPTHPESTAATTSTDPGSG